jgi:hypothetical protein
MMRLGVALIAALMACTAWIAQANAGEEAWYEGLESSTIPYDKTDWQLDRRSVESELYNETTESRTAENAWSASTQMMVKPAAGS